MVVAFVVVVVVGTVAVVVVDKADIVVATTDTMKDKRKTSDVVAGVDLTS